MNRRWLSTTAVGLFLLLAQDATSAPPPRKPAATPSDPLGFHVQLDFPGTFTGYFTKCSGLGSVTRGEGEREHSSKERPKAAFGDVVCSRGLTSSLDLWSWRKQTEQGDAGKKDGMLTVFDDTFRPVAQWQLTQAWPREVVLGEDFTEQVSLRFEDATRIK